MRHHHQGAPLALLAVAFIAACGDSATGPNAVGIGAVTITAARTDLQIGESVQLAVTLLDRHGAVTFGPAVTWTTSDPSVATISPGGLVVAAQAGLARIEASARGKSGSVSIRVIPAPCSAAAATRTISAGESRTETLTERDCLLEGSPAQGWRFTLPRRSRLQIDLTSDAFDAVLAVFDGGMNFVTWDDDGGEGLNSRLVLDLAAGSYIIWAASWSLESAGAYRLSVAEVEGRSCEEAVGALAADITVAGALGGASCILEDGRFADPWRLELTEQTSLRIDHMSDELDAFLILTTAAGEFLAADDDGGDGLNSRLVVTLPAGAYTVWATVFWGSRAGRYTLSVRRTAASAPAPSTPPPAALPAPSPEIVPTPPTPFQGGKGGPKARF